MVQIKKLNSADSNFNQALQQLLSFDTIMDESVDTTVAQILADIKARGNAAVIEYTHRFDHVHASSINTLELTRRELQQSLSTLPVKQRQALEHAASRIRSYHEKQVASSWHYQEADDTMLGQKVTPLDRVGLYVPGGKASYPSSVLMNAIPAKVAGVKELFMVVPTPHGEKNDMVLAAAAISDVDRVFTIGGAQAIGALAYGTETIPQVDKIVGPGNAYVAAAKRRVFGIVGIDMVAGPSEILVICDGKTDPDWIAMDLFSQAEHDELAQSILLSPDAGFLDKVAQSIDQLIETMPRKNVICAALENRGALIRVRDLEEACTIANSISPEHLELSVDRPEHWVDKIRHAGAIFMGRHTCEALGDYCAGPNHVLPTSRTARFSSPLGVYDFQKRSSLIQVSEQGAAELGEVASILANCEGLQAHARSAEYRIKA
ncbi:histidinol dehydrogenase [Nitrosomonas marina]|uniref:Histidinol dehydrogenase n=1 Tax=Nitrosomonas marina TaxID=917 RepID=A0A1I0AWT5_9PROT|nr:histidinol dehydrogenase [Nitrosomonas marina]SES98461.1 histidinol dehydrogenase [Nitrosomonas marina]